MLPVESVSALTQTEAAPAAADTAVAGPSSAAESQARVLAALPGVAEPPVPNAPANDTHASASAAAVVAAVTPPSAPAEPDLVLQLADARREIAELKSRRAPEASPGQVDAPAPTSEPAWSQGVSARLVNWAKEDLGAEAPDHLLKE